VNTTITAAQRIRAAHSELGIIKHPNVGREEYLDYMTFKANRRPLFTEIFGPLPGVKTEWAKQGATPGEIDFSAFTYRYADDGWLPVTTGFMGGCEEIILEETDTLLIYRDGYGRTMRMAKGVSTIALPCDYPVANMDDWLRIKPHYEFSEARLAGDWQAAAAKHRAAERVVTVAIPGGFDEPRALMGEEALAMACYDQPELLHDILATLTATACQVLDRVSAAVPIDHLFVHEDMAGRSGPLFGPTQVREFLCPYYRQVWTMLQNRGARLFNQDSDGNIEAILPAFLEAGLNVIHPCEPAAGMDIVKLRQTYGTRLAFIGGIDKHVLRAGNAAIDAELAYKVPPMIATGGCVLALDHRIPNGTPLAGYRHYIKRMWEMLEAAR